MDFDSLRVRCMTRLEKAAALLDRTRSLLARSPQEAPNVVARCRGGLVVDRRDVRPHLRERLVVEQADRPVGAGGHPQVAGVGMIDAEDPPGVHDDRRSAKRAGLCVVDRQGSVLPVAHRDPSSVRRPVDDRVHRIHLPVPDLAVLREVDDAHRERVERRGAGHDGDGDGRRG